jgi:cytoskeletal protein RodZ
MKLNKKIAGVLIALGLVSGSVAAIGLQTHASQQPNPSSTPQIQQSVAQTAQITVEQTPTETDKDNIQQQNGLDDKTEMSSEKAGTETADANENLSGNGHQDAGGSSIDHQFEGVE